MTGLRVVRVDKIIKIIMGKIDSESLSEWYDAYSDGLMLYARNWLGEEAACDSVQVAFTRLMGQVVSPRDVKAWLFRTVRNEAITQLRQRSRRSRHSERLSIEYRGWFESTPEDLIDARTAEEILLTLPHEQSEVVLLRIWGQLTLKQIASVVGSPLTTIHSRYKTALANIKERMQRSCRTTTD